MLFSYKVIIDFMFVCFSNIIETKGKYSRKKI